MDVQQILKLDEAEDVVSLLLVRKEQTFKKLLQCDKERKKDY